MDRPAALVLIATLSACFAIPAEQDALEDGSPLCIFNCPGSWADDTASDDDDAVADYFCDVAANCEDNFQSMFDSEGECESDVAERLDDCGISESFLRDCASDIYELDSDSGSGQCAAYYDAMYRGECAAIVECLINGGGDTGGDEAKGPPGPIERPIWSETVGARLRADARAFRAEGRGFTATIGGMYGRFDADGAALTVGEETIQVRGAGFASEPLLARPVGLGECGRDLDARGECVRRLEWTADGITEWWSSSSRGFEQGWIVEAAPPGGERLSIEVAIDGARPSLGGGGLRLVGVRGGQIRVSDPIAWDATGRELPAWYELIDGGYRIRVDDDGAEYPVEVDPVYETGTELTEGDEVALGYAVAGAGDVNGDGYDDVIVGALGAAEVYLYTGGPDGIATAAADSVTGSATYFGWSVGAAGDVNDDGFADIIVGTYSEDTGYAYVYHGSASGLPSSASTSLPDGGSNEYFGSAVSGAGDVNGDGFDDIVVGAFYYSTYGGKAVVYYGSSAGITTSGATTLTGSSSSRFGYSVAAAGDVNGDGVDDLIVGAYAHSSSKGAAYLYHGVAGTGPATTASQTLTGGSTGDWFGFDVSGAGDTNLDGYGDIVVGAPEASSDNGQAFVFYGSASGIATAGSTTISGASTDEWLGYSVAGVGDVDIDGYDDVLLGAPQYSSSDGRAYLHRGSSAGVGSSPDTTLTGAADSYFGFTVAAAGDVDADDAGDVIVGAPYASSDDDGAAYVYRGKSEIDADNDGTESTADCDDTDPDIGPDATEIVNDGIDQNCDDVDECYTDRDGDGFGSTDTSPGSSLSCAEGEGGASNDDDCDDYDDDTFPGAAERDSTTACMNDDDGDGYGDEGDGLDSGDAFAPGTDCDDSDSSAHPGGSEAPADGIDQDCDDVDQCYEDSDGDNYGSDGVVTGSSMDCDDGTGAANQSDCDDGDSDISPGADEICNGRDDDCDERADDEDSEIVGAPVWYLDSDDDGWGNENREYEACNQPDGYVDERGEGDCDDGDADVYPGAPEHCYDDHDYDCDGDVVDNDDAVDAQTWYADEDGDGYGSDDDTVTGCERPDNGAEEGGDCDDGSPNVNPGQEEEDKTDGVDQDCDGKVEKSWIAGRTIFSGCSSTGSGVPGALAVVLAASLLARRRAALLAGLLAASPAAAAGRYDAHGFVLVPNDGDALDLMSTWRAEEYRQWSFGGTLLGEYSAGGVAEYQQYDDDIDTENLQQGYVALNLGGIFALTKGIALSVSAPGYLGQDSSWGDLRVAIPLNAAFPRGKPAGLTFGVIPYGDIPTGDELRWRGNRGMGGGITFATGWNAPRWTLAANVGGFYQPLIENMNLRGGPHLLAALGTGFLVSDNVALRGEVNYRPSLVEQEPYDAESPGEVVLSAKGTYAWGLNWTAGLGTAWSGGVGAAPVRLFVGGGAALGKEVIKDQDADKVPDPIDACKTEPEVVNKYKDRDGCPDQLGDLTVKVVDEDQHVVPDATATSSSAVAQSDATGTAVLSGLIPGIVTGNVSHPVYDTASFDVDPLVEGPNEKTVTLRFKTVPVTVTAVGPDGLPVDARVRFEGPTDFGYRFLGDDGTATFDLRPGDWRMLISTDNGGTERREVKLAPGQTEPVQVGVNFRPAMAVVDTVKKEVLIKEQIYFDVGKDTIRPESMPIVSQLSNLLLDHPEILQVEVQGHTDSDGDDKRNLDLSQRRVEAVCLALIQSGVGAGRLVPRGYGESKPMASNSAEEGKALNRRVQFVIIAMDESAVPTKGGN